MAYRRSGLEPWHAAAVICVWSAALALPLWLLSGGPPRLLAAPPGEVALQAVAQGVVAGVLGLACYGAAIRRLGAGLAATSGAAVPPLTALGGAWLLGEAPNAATLVGVVLVAAGLGLATGAVELLRRRRRA